MNSIAERNQLVEENLPIVRKIAGKLRASSPRYLDFEDEHNGGVIGLIRAAETYEPERGLSFGTYAGHKIRGAILDERRRADWLSRRRDEDAKKRMPAIDSVEDIQLRKRLEHQEQFDVVDNHDALQNIEASDEWVAIASRLSKQEQQILALIYVAELPTYEIDRMLGLYEGKAWHVAQSVLKRMRKYYGAE